QAALVAAFQAWTRDTARTLAVHLATLGLMEVDQRAAVETMVAIHLKKHGGDAQQGLISVPTEPGVREALESLADYDVQASLAQIATSRMNAVRAQDDPDTTCDIGAITTLEAQDSAGRFRLPRLHERGGLGEVSVALDRE